MFQSPRLYFSRGLVSRGWNDASTRTSFMGRPYERFHSYVSNGIEAAMCDSSDRNNGPAPESIRTRQESIRFRYNGPTMGVQIH